MVFLEALLEVVSFVVDTDIVDKTRPVEEIENKWGRSGPVEPTTQVFGTGDRPQLGPPMFCTVGHHVAATLAWPLADDNTVAVM